MDKTHLKKQQVSKVPVGIKVISVFYYCWAAILGILTLLFAFNIEKASIIIEDIDITANQVIATFITILVVLTLIYFFLARGLWKGERWARIFTIIMCGVIVAGIIYEKRIEQSIFILVLHTAIFFYLILSKYSNESDAGH